MKALVYTKNLELTYREEENPPPRAGESLIKVEAAGICGSDMHAYHGHDSRRVPPLILGHELAGRVMAGPLEGRRVVVNPLVTCLTCDYCAGGRSNLCPERDMMSIKRSGAFAEYVTSPDRNLVEIPESADPVKLSLAEPAAVGLHAFDLARRIADRPLAELKSLVIGGGGVGLLAALLLKAYGNQDVTVAEVNHLRREAALKATGGPVYDPMNDPAPADNQFGLVLDAVGSPTTRSLAVSAARPGGIIIHLGLQDSSGQMDVRKITLQEITFIGIYTYTMNDFRAAAGGLQSGLFGDLDWIETRPLAEGARAFEDLDRGRSSAAKMVLVPNSR